MGTPDPGFIKDALVGAAKARKGNLVYDFSLNLVRILQSRSILVIVVWEKSILLW